MIVKRFFVAILILNLLKVNSQSIDSLLAVSHSLSTDTARINLFYKEGFKFRNIEPQYSYDCAKAGELIANESNSKRHIAKINNLFGVLYYKKGDFKKALQYHKRALSLRIECNDVLGIAYSQTNLGNIYTDLRLYLKAEESYLDALNKYNLLNDVGRSIDCLNNLGVLKKNIKQYDAALENFSLALKMAKEINDYETISICLNNVAVAEGLKGDVDKAIAYNEDALKIRNMMENTLEVADSYLNLAPLYIFQKDLVRAKQYIDTAYYIGTKYDYFEIKYKAFRNFATYYSEIKDFSKAYYWLKKFDDTKDSISIQQSLSNEVYDFNDDIKKLETKKNQNPPILFFNGLAILCIIIIGFVFKFKR